MMSVCNEMVLSCGKRSVWKPGMKESSGLVRAERDQDPPLPASFSTHSQGDITRTNLPHRQRETVRMWGHNNTDRGSRKLTRQGGRARRDIGAEATEAEKKAGWEVKRLCNLMTLMACSCTHGARKGLQRHVQGDC
jgi:hypothetical protein